MIAKSLLFLWTLLFTSLAWAAPPETSFLPARPGFAWSFPKDHWAHPDYKSEWWYFTGHLETLEEVPKRFAYQVTFFRVGLSRTLPPGQSNWRSRSLVMGHLALSDLTGTKHYFSEVLRRASPVTGGFSEPQKGPLAWCLGPAGTDELWQLDWTGQGFAFQSKDRAKGFGVKLVTTPEKPRIFQGPGGLSKKSSQESESAASLYYSYTRLKTTGTVFLNGKEHPVRGLSWMDKEFGSSKLAKDQVGWDWFSLQLKDGKELMIYVLRNTQGGVSHAQGTLVDSDGSVRYLQPKDWKLSSQDTWTSPENEATYPLHWTLSLPEEKLDLRVIPEFKDQENRSQFIAGMAYWEGAVKVTDPSGEQLGQGFVEMTGYGKTRRPTPEG